MDGADVRESTFCHAFEPTIHRTSPHVGPVHAFVSRLQSEEATGALAKINLHTPDIPWSVQICLPSVCDLVASLRSARSPSADNEDSSAGVCRLGAPSRIEEAALN